MSTTTTYRRTHESTFNQVGRHFKTTHRDGHVARSTFDVFDLYENTAILMVEETSRLKACHIILDRAQLEELQGDIGRLLKQFDQCEAHDLVRGA